MNKQEIRTEALARATGGLSLANYPAILEGFIAKGVPEAEIKPRENVLTFEAWRALGRHVRRGEHGVKVVTFIERANDEGREDGTIERRTYRFPRTTTVFHVTQTDLDEVNRP